jgi:hypothetical protein
MLKALICYLTGRHAYAVTCEPGSIFLECRTCGRRSTGWALRNDEQRCHASLERGKPAPIAVPARRPRA